MSRLPRSGGATLPGLAVSRCSSGVAGRLVLHSLQKQNCSAARRAVPVALWWRWGWIAPGRSALGGWAACSAYYDLGGKFAPMAAPLLSLPLPPPLLWTLSRDRSGRWGWVGLDRLHGLRLVAWLVCWPGLAAGGVAGWGCCGSGGGLPAPLLLRRSCSPAGLPLCLYGRGLLRAAVWPCSCWPAAWRCRLRWAGRALSWHDPAGLVGWGQAVPVRHTAQFFTLYFVTFHPSLSG